MMAKALCESLIDLDVRDLQRRDLLRPGLLFGWCAGDDLPIIIKTEERAIILIFPDERLKKLVERRIPIHWTKCHLGGERPWFNCMAETNGRVCGRRVAKLYRFGEVFACRHCFGLVYASQQENPAGRDARRAQKIKLRLGGSPNPLEPFPPKPRGMHWRTYRRLREQAESAHAAVNDELSRQLLHSIRRAPTKTSGLG
jgi:hypothetical protein